MRTASIQWEVWEARLERGRKVSGEDRKNSQNVRSFQNQTSFGGALFENLDTHLFGSTRAVVQSFSLLALLLSQGKVKLQKRKANSCQGPGTG